MSDKDIFIKVEYVVAWAGANVVPLELRTHNTLDDAAEFAASFLDRPSIRIERVAVKTQIDIEARKPDIEKILSKTVKNK